MAKLARSTASGSRRCSPQASDQHTKSSSVKASRGAVGFQMSWRASTSSDAHMSATAPAAANISARPPRRRARATVPMIAATLSAPTTTGNAHAPGRRAGMASSQNSKGPAW